VEARGSVWSAGAPARLLARPFYRGGEGGPSTRQYDVAADGRFLMMREDAKDTDAAPSIVVVQNWFEELKAKVPAK